MMSYGQKGGAPYASPLAQGQVPRGNPFGFGQQPNFYGNSGAMPFWMQSTGMAPQPRLPVSPATQFGPALPNGPTGLPGMQSQLNPAPLSIPGQGIAPNALAQLSWAQQPLTPQQMFAHK